MSVLLTSNFFNNARGLTLTDGGGITWSINKNTNAITGTVGAGGANAANPTAKVGTSAVNGSANTWMRSDAAPPIDLTASYAWTGKVGWFGAAAGSQPTITGAKGGNTALASLLTELATLGLVVDSTT